MEQISIVLADDHQVVREGIRALLSLDPIFIVLAEAENGRAAVALYRELKPDVLLMDIAMPDLNGLEATRQIIALDPKAKILVLTAHPDAAYIDGAIQAGAVGFLLKRSSAKRLYQAIREVVAGRRPIGQGNGDSGSSISTRLKAKAAAPSVHLTSREVEVLQLIAEGKANKQAAVVLGISTKTIEKHRAKVMAKLDIHDTAGLTRHAIAAGIIESSSQNTCTLE